MILHLDTLLVAALVLIAVAAVASVALAWDIRHHTRRPTDPEPVPPEWVNHPTVPPRPPCERPHRRGDWRDNCHA